MNLKPRQDVPVEETWNLDNLYPSEEAYLADQAVLTKQAAELFAKDPNQLKDPVKLAELIQEFEQLYIRIIRLNTYASLSISTDMANTENQQRSSQLSLFLNPIYVQMTEIETAIKKLPVETLEQIVKAEPTLKSFIHEILLQKPHQLSDELETALVTLSDIMDLPYTVYGQAKLADMSFPSFEVNGVEYPLSFVLYENHYQHHPETAVRRAAFEAFSKRLRESQHTIAAAYIAQVQKEKKLATLRKHDSVFDYLLLNQEIPRAIYDQHIDTIMEHLAPVMRKYVGLLKEVHQLDKVTFPDLQVPLDSAFVPTVTIDEAKDYARNSLSILGDEYAAVVNAALDDRWIDWAQNIGKSTGGFCTSPYGHNSYILMSWTGVLSDVFTLVHELGHAGHFQLANKYLNLSSTRPSLYFIEAPSTMNEMLLMNDLIKRNDDPRYQRFVLSSLLGNTYYHNYVTHFLEAHFQREVYRIADKEEPLTTERLHQLKKQTLQQFWGDAVDIDDNAALTWMRQPHYYMGLYSYTYSAGLSIGTVMSKQIREQGEEAIKRWTDVLKVGGSLGPVELAQVAGVDISKPDVLIETIGYIESLVDQCIGLTKQVGE